MLANQLDSITETYSNPDWLEAMSYADEQAWSAYAQACNEADNAMTPDLSDLHTLYLQDDIIERDTGVLVEYFDGDVYGVGIVMSWHSDPFSLYNEDDSEDYAFILSEDGKSSTYCHYSAMNPICEVEKYETMEGGAIVPPMQTTVAFGEQGSGSGQNSVRDLYELPMSASVPSTVSA